MAIKNTNLGGVNFSTPSARIKPSDLNDTFDEVAERISNNLSYLTDVFEEVYGDSVVAGCLVEEQSTPDQTVQVSAGTVIISGVSYSVSADATVNLANADATNPRWDIVSVGTDGVINTTEGTAAATPTVPTLPSNEVPLAVIYRAVGDNVVSDGEMYDCRRLISESFFEADYDRVEEDDDSYVNKKSIVVPAFRCQKEIFVKFDLTTYIKTDLDKYPTEREALVYAKLYINGVGFQEHSVYNRVQNLGGSGDGILSVNESQFAIIKLTSDDVDFTQNITLDLYLHGREDAFDTGDDALAVNYNYVVEGK